MSASYESPFDWESRFHSMIKTDGRDEQMLPIMSSFVYTWLLVRHLRDGSNVPDSVIIPSGVFVYYISCQERESNIRNNSDSARWYNKTIENENEKRQIPIDSLMITDDDVVLILDSISAQVISKSLSHVKSHCTFVRRLVSVAISTQRVSIVQKIIGALRTTNLSLFASKEDRMYETFSTISMSTKIGALVYGNFSDANDVSTLERLFAEIGLSIYFDTFVDELNANSIFPGYYFLAHDNVVGLLRLIKSSDRFRHLVTYKNSVFINGTDMSHFSRFFFGDKSEFVFDQGILYGAAYLNSVKCMKAILSSPELRDQICAFMYPDYLVHVFKVSSSIDYVRLFDDPHFSFLWSYRTQKHGLHLLDCMFLDTSETSAEYCCSMAGYSLDEFLSVNVKRCTSDGSRRNLIRTYMSRYPNNIDKNGEQTVSRFLRVKYHKELIEYLDVYNNSIAVTIANKLDELLMLAACGPLSIFDRRDNDEQDEAEGEESDVHLRVFRRVLEVWLSNRDDKINDKNPYGTELKRLFNNFAGDTPVCIVMYMLDRFGNDLMVHQTMTLENTFGVTVNDYDQKALPVTKEDFDLSRNGVVACHRFPQIEPKTINVPATIDGCHNPCTLLMLYKRFGVCKNGEFYDQYHEVFKEICSRRGWHNRVENPRVEDVAIAELREIFQ